jgi:hypothetical protein
MRYLEQCLADLKSAHSHCSSSSAQDHIRTQLPSFAHLSRHNDNGEVTPTTTTQFRDDHDDASDSDEEMSEAPTSPHSYRPHSGSVFSHQPSVSPAILPSAQTSPEILSKPGKFGSYSGSVYHSHTHSARSSALPSPAFEPQTQAAGPTYSFAPLTSPALRPQGGGGEGLEKDDHEATAALLMLNTDRRSWSSTNGSGGGNGGIAGRSMSVKDLLSG